MSCTIRMAARRSCPFHARRDTGPGLLRAILRDVGLELEQFIDLL